MQTRVHADRAKRARWVALAIGVLLLLAVIACLIWHLTSSLGTRANGVFHQTPSGPGTNQPISAQNLSHLHVIWSYTSAPDLANDVKVANGIAYTDNQEAVVAIRGGTRLWRSSVPGAGPGRLLDTMFQPSGNVIYLTVNPITSPPSMDGDVYALDADTGQELWRYHSSSPVGPITSDQTTLYMSTTHGVDALEATTGALRWHYPLTQDSLGGPFLSSLFTAQGTLYIAFMTSPYQAEPSLIALDGRTGSVQWQIQETGVSPAGAVVVNGVIYRQIRLNRYIPDPPAGATSHWDTTYELSAVDGTSGHALWEVPLDQAATDGWGPRASGDLLYLSGRDEIQARDLGDGHLVWNTGPLRGNAIVCDPAMDNGVIYVATKEFVPAWSHPARYWVSAFDAQSGKLVRALQDGDPTFQVGSIAADQEYVYVVGTQVSSGLRYSATPELDVLGI